MAITLGEAIVKLGADTSGLRGGLDGAERETRGWVGRVGGVMAGLGGVVAAGLAAGVAAVGAIGVAAFDITNQIEQSTKRLTSQLNLSTEQAEQYAETIKNIYGQNFGDSIEDVSNVVAQANQNLGDLPADQIEEAAIGAIALADAFEDIDEGSVLNAVKALTEDFGVSIPQALDIITYGMQEGLNTSGDFLDSIREYSVYFGDAGASAWNFLSILDSGLKTGVLGTDKVADAFKEFQIRIQDGSETTHDGLEQLGIDADVLTEGIADGSISIFQAFRQVLGGLKDVDDQLLKNQIGVMLFGTQFEDLTDDVVTGLSPWSVTLAEVSGRTDTLNDQYENLGTILEGLKRRGQLALVPLGDALYDMAMNAMPLVNKAFEWFETNVVPALQKAAEWAGEFSSRLFTKLEEGQPFMEALKETLREMLPPEQAEAIIGFIDTLASKAESAGTGLTNIVNGLEKIGEGDISGGVANITTGMEDLAEALGIPVPVLYLLTGLLGASLLGKVVGLLAPLGALAGAIGGVGAAAGGAAPLLLIFAGGFAAASLVLHALGSDWESLATTVGQLKDVISEVIGLVVGLFDAYNEGYAEGGIQGAIEKSDEFLSLLEEKGGVFDTIVSGLTSFRNAMVSLDEMFATAGSNVTRFLEGLEIISGRVAAGFERIKTAIENLKNSLFGLDQGGWPDVPDYYIPGSPPPLAIGLRMINSEMVELEKNAAAVSAAWEALPNIQGFGFAGPNGEIGGGPFMGHLERGRDRPGGLQPLKGYGSPAGGAGGAGGGVYVENLNVYAGSGSASDVAKATRKGIDEAMRAKGEL